MEDRTCSRCGYVFEPLEGEACPRCQHLAEENRLHTSQGSSTTKPDQQQNIRLHGAQENRYTPSNAPLLQPDYPRSSVFSIKVVIGCGIFWLLVLLGVMLGSGFRNASSFRCIREYRVLTDSAQTASATISNITKEKVRSGNRGARYYYKFCYEISYAIKGENGREVTWRTTFWNDDLFLYLPSDDAKQFLKKRVGDSFTIVYSQHDPAIMQCNSTPLKPDGAYFNIMTILIISSVFTLIGIWFTVLTYKIWRRSEREKANRS